MAKAFGQITIVDLADNLVWKGNLIVPPSNPKNGWAYYNEKDGRSYIYNEKEKKWDILADKGLGIKSVKRYYKLGVEQPFAPSLNPPDESWQEVEPPYTKGQKLYYVDLNTYTDETYQYSQVNLSSSYIAAKDAQESIDNLSIGGRNLLLDSSTPIVTNEEKMAQYKTAVTLEPKQEATFSMLITPAKEIEKIMVCTSQGKYCLAEFPITNSKTQLLEKTFHIDYANNYTPTEDLRNSDIVIYRLPKDIPFTDKNFIVNHEMMKDSQVKVAQELEVIQSGLGIPSYDNPRDFIPWSGANLVKSGKNLLGIRGKQHITSYYGIKTKIDPDDFIRYYGQTNIANPTFCTLKIRGLNPKAKEEIQLKYTQKNSQIPIKAWIEEIEKELYIVLQIQAAANTKIDTTIRFEVVPKSRASEEKYEPYNGRTYSIDFKNPVYGGEVNWTAGFIKTYGHLSFRGTESWKEEIYKGKKVFILNLSAEPEKSADLSHIWCNKYPTLSELEAELKDRSIFLDTTGRIIILDSAFPKIDDFKKSLMTQYESKKPLEIVYAKKDTNDEMIHFPPMEITNAEKQATFYADTSKIQVSGYIFTINEDSMIHWAKLEKGNKATDWTPAPEDLQAGLERISHQIETNQPEILKFKVKEGASDRLVFSPPIIKFSSFQVKGKERIKIIPDNYSLFLAGTNITSLTYLEGGTVCFNLELFSNAKYSNELANFTQVQMALKKDDTSLFLFKAKGSDGILVQKALICKFGLIEEGAKLNVNASNINMAIQNTKISFDGNGLHIQNGGFTIQDQLNNEVFYTDEQGNLVLKGIIEAKAGKFNGEIYATKGVFNGVVHATAGEFSGAIYAKEGTIAGFSIFNNQLKSEGEHPNLIMDGKTGEVVANKITLGEGAKISNYLKLGQNIELRNTTSDSEPFLLARNQVDGQLKDTLRFNSDGTIVAGESNYVKIDGQNGSIYSKNYSLGHGWKLSNEETILNNVIVRGSIQSSVIEHQDISAVGGILLIRPSSQITEVYPEESKVKVNKNIKLIEGAESFKKGDYCKINNYNVKITAVLDNILTLEILDQLKDTFDNVFNSFLNSPLVDFGAYGSVGIGINATNYNNLIPSQAISVFDYTASGIVPHIILGKLPNEDSFGAAKGTYGLYAENVILKGSLVTYAEKEKSYSGISTIYSNNAPNSKTQFDKIPGSNFQSGEILIWAGADNSTKQGIENSKFFVDRNGNLFAGSGYFKGTIITDATISASQLETATIIGSNNGQAALIIKDTKEGILFTNQLEEEVFKVSDTKMVVNTDSIVFNDKTKITSSGEVMALKINILDTLIAATDYYENIVESNMLSCTNGRITYSKKIKINDLTENPSSYIDFRKGIILSGNGRENFIRCSEEDINFDKKSRFNENIFLGENIEYRRVYNKDTQELIGHDLYIN